MKEKNKSRFRFFNQLKLFFLIYLSLIISEIIARFINSYIFTYNETFFELLGPSSMPDFLFWFIFLCVPFYLVFNLVTFFGRLKELRYNKCYIFLSVFIFEVIGIRLVSNLTDFVGDFGLGIVGDFINLIVGSTLEFLIILLILAFVFVNLFRKFKNNG